MSCNMYVTGSGKPFSPSNRNNSNSSGRASGNASSDSQGNGQPGNNQQGKDRLVNDTTRANIKFNKARVDEIATKLREKGWSNLQIAGALGAGYQESKFELDAVGDKNRGGSYGMWQYNGVRNTALRNYASERNLDWNTVDAQVGFLDYEMKNVEKAAYSKWQNAGNTSEMAGAFYRYERFQDWNLDTAHGNNERTQRLRYTNTFYDYLQESGNPSRQ